MVVAAFLVIRGIISDISDINDNNFIIIIRTRRDGKAKKGFRKRDSLESEDSKVRIGDSKVRSGNHLF